MDAVTRAARQAGNRRSRSWYTRGRIAAAAAALFLERGYNSVSMRDLARFSGMSVPGITRHYPTKQAVLSAVLTEVHMPAQADAPVRDGDHRLLVRLAGEATSDDHPAHAFLEKWYRDRVANAAPSPSEAPHARAEIAIQDGRALLARYGITADRRGEPPAAPGDPARPVEEAPNDRLPDGPGFSTSAAPPEPEAYTADLNRRDEIVDGARTMFIRRGYTATSMSSIAVAVGTSKATLFHHFGNKYNLLLDVLARRDALGLETLPAPTHPPGDRLVAMAARKRQWGLIQLYTVLASEAAGAEHPGYTYFRERFARTIEFFADLLGTEPPGSSLLRGATVRDEATLLVALWEGLQTQMLYEREASVLTAVVRLYAESIRPPA